MIRKLIKLLSILRNRKLFYALLSGSAAGTEHKRILESICADVVFDIGANRGQFALISRNVFPNAQIFSFEPLSEPRLIFQKVFEKDENIFLFPYAIGNNVEVKNMHVSKADDSSSFLPISQTQTNLYPGTEEVEVREVQIYPLSNFFTNNEISINSLLKIDVQGYELQVLEGCESLINQFAYCYIECSFIELYKGQALSHQVIAFLASHGFCLEGIYNIAYDKHGIAVQADFFFRHESPNP
jgi:FkbM family methyltransferase